MGKTEVGDEDSLWNYGCDQCEKVFWDENFLDLYTSIEENLGYSLSVIFAKWRQILGPD